MTHILAALDFLESLDAQWSGFCREAASLAGTFAGVTTEPELEEAVRRLVELCQEYPYLALLLRQASSKRPPVPKQAPEFNPREVVKLYPNPKEAVGPYADPREVAKLYQDLLKRLKPNEKR